MMMLCICPILNRSVEVSFMNFMLASACTETAS